jgi:hypothetical protein
MPPALFAMEIGSHFLSRPSPPDHDPPILSFAVHWMTDRHHYAQLFSVEMESHKLFCSGSSETVILLISATQVAGIIGMSHRRLGQHFSLMFANVSNFSFDSLSLLQSSYVSGAVSRLALAWWPWSWVSPAILLPCPSTGYL